MKNALKSFIILFLAALIINGCAQNSSQDTNSITIWHWMSDRDEAFQELAKKYEAETNIKVKFDLYAPSEAYSQRIKASAQTNTLPDIFGVLGEKRDFGSFIKSGFVADLTEHLSASKDGASPWKEEFFPKALAVNEFKEGNEFAVTPGIYGIPMDVTTIQMLYNKSLYAKAGLDPEKAPKTWDEFVSDCEALKNKGIPCLVSGFGEIWMIDALASNFAMNSMGQQKVFDTYAGKVAYTDPDWIKVLYLFKTITSKGILVEGAVTMVNKTAEQTFANERAAFAFNGSWSVNVYKGMNPNLKYAAILPPKVNASNPMWIWGGAGSSYVVNNQSPRKEKAIQFLNWMSKKEQQAFLADKTQNLPANRKCLGQISEVLAQFADDMENTTHPNVYPSTEIPAVTEAFDKGIQSILIGEKTPEQVAQDVQRVKEKELKKRS